MCSRLQQWPSRTVDDDNRSSNSDLTERKSSNLSMSIMSKSKSPMVMIPPFHRPKIHLHKHLQASQSNKITSHPKTEHKYRQQIQALHLPSPQRGHGSLSK